MTDLQIGFTLILGIVILIYVGMHVSIALALLSYVGVWAVKGNAAMAGKMLALAAADSISHYEFGVVPLFVLMGMFISVSEIGRETFQVANFIFGRIRGGLGIATVAANAVFAAVTGISIASAAVFTKVAVPEMIRLGYQPRFAVGVVTGSSVLGMLIPPSLLLILFGILTETSIGDLFTAGIIPGLTLTLAFSLLILIMARVRPSYIMTGQAVDATNTSGEDDMTLKAAFLKIIPITSLIVLVLGGIYNGWFTPPEAGAVGALGALILALLKRRLTLSNLWQVLVETGHVTVAILFLIISANMYGRMLALSGINHFIGTWIGESGLGLYGFISIYILIILFMGTILDSTSILMIIIPLVQPTLAPLEINLVWFGLITIIAVEIGLLTPPLGICAYVVKGTLDDPRITLGDIFIGAFPFVLIMIGVLVLVVLFPWLTLALI